MPLPPYLYEITEDVRRDMEKKAFAFQRIYWRFYTEGAFIAALDDPDALTLGVAGSRITYVDDGSLCSEPVSQDDKP